MNRTTRLISATAATALLLTGLAVSPAAADPPCYRGEVCLYHQNALVAKFLPIESGDCSYGTAMYDRIFNNSSTTQRAWSGTNCTGRDVLVSGAQNISVNLFWSVGGY